MEEYAAATNLVEIRTHLIADQKTLTMYCGKQLGGYWYFPISASAVENDRNGICEECKQAIAQRRKHFPY